MSRTKRPKYYIGDPRDLRKRLVHAAGCTYRRYQYCMMCPDVYRAEAGEFIKDAVLLGVRIPRRFRYLIPWAKERIAK